MAITAKEKFLQLLKLKIESRSMINKNFCFNILFILLTPLYLKAKDSHKAYKADTSALRVGVTGSEPFLMMEGRDPEGISIEIWQSIASEAGWRYSIYPYNSVPDALKALTEGKIDLIAGPTSITAYRVRRARFSQPYYQSSLSILSRTDSPGIWERISPFFSRRLFAAIGFFLFILCCVGTLLWMAERKASPQQFPPNPSRGIANGMWCAIVTMSTTGYGDIAPVTFLGRIIAGAWMVISLIFATSMVAGIASTLTLTGMDRMVISKAEELKNKKVAVLPRSPASKFVREFEGKQTAIQNLEEGYRLLKNRQVDAVVFDRPQMLYFLKHHHDNDVAVSQAEYLKEGYGFAFPLNSDIVHTVNIHLLHLAENGRLDRIAEGWLGPPSL